MLIITFWILVFFSLFSYFIYPLILLAIHKTSPSKPLTEQYNNDKLPHISVIITVHNEEKRIRDKIINTLNSEYPKELLQIIIASDGSTDNTNSIAIEYEKSGITLTSPKERLGKENAQKSAIAIAQGEILIFSDVATQIPEDAFTTLVTYFNDPGIGAISSEDKIITSNGAVAGENSYVKYEMWLRQLESSIAGLVGLSGSFFAVRKHLCNDWDIYSPSDFNTALNCVKNNMRAVNAPDVFGIYSDLQDTTKEYNRKLRTVIRGMTGLSRHPEVLNPLKFGFFSFQIFGHKIMRWLEPWFLISLLTINSLLVSSHLFFSFTLLLQVLFYGVAFLAHYQKKWQEYSIVRLIYFFVQVNLALMDASRKFLTGQRMTTWKPSAR